MCEQCLTDAVFYLLKEDGTVDEEPLPGWQLMQATKDGHKMKKGDFGLVRCNDPSFIWTEPPVVDETMYLADEDYTALEDELFMQFLEKYRPFNEQFSASIDCIEEAVILHEAAVKRGYDMVTSPPFNMWLCDYLGRWMQNHSPISHTDERIEKIK